MGAALTSLRARGAAPASAASDVVVVVHGLWLTGWVMSRFCARLRRAGWRAVTFSYPSMRAAADENAASLARFIAGIPADRIHLVAHSLGGLISLLYLHHGPDPRLSRVILLGSPVRGSSAATRLAGTRIGRAFLGHARDLLLQGVCRTSAGTVLPVGVIAGTLGLGLGRLVARLHGDHDGTVRVEETRLDDAADFITLPVTHTGLLFSGRVAAQVVHFLRDGRFSHQEQ